MSEPARAVPPRPPLEVRVGSATNALEPIPGAQRSLAAGPAQWAAPSGKVRSSRRSAPVQDPVSIRAIHIQTRSGARASASEAAVSRALRSHDPGASHRTFRTTSGTAK